jgi:hypothetical protein
MYGNLTQTQVEMLNDPKSRNIHQLKTDESQNYFEPEIIWHGDKVGEFLPQKIKENIFEASPIMEPFA